MKTKIALVLTVVAVAFGFASPGFAASDSNDGKVNVNITSQVRVDIAPENLNFEGAQPGSLNTTTNNGYDGVEIENIGSDNITNIWMATSSAEEDLDGDGSSDTPYGTGFASNYDAGDFLMMEPTGQAGTVNADTEGYHYAGHREYNETNPLSYVKTDAGNNNVRYGRFRTDSEQFFWWIDNAESSGTDQNYCSDSDSTFYWGQDEHTKDNLGSVDIGGSDINSKSLGQDASGSQTYGEVDVWFDTDDGNKSYTAYTFCGQGTDPGADNSTYVMFRRYDLQTPDDSNQFDSTTANNNQYLLNSTSAANLNPGEHFTVGTKINIPYGVSAGSLGEGTVKVYADNQ